MSSLFIVAGLIALLLDTHQAGGCSGCACRGPCRCVYLSFVAVVVLVILGVATIVVGQAKTATSRFNDSFTHGHGATGQTSADRR